MVNDFLSGVSNQLYVKFGSDYKYYVENVKQGLPEKCFTIDCLIPLQRSRSNVLYDRTIPIVVHYFSPDNENAKNDCYEKAEQVVEALEIVPFNDSWVRGENISWQIDDGVLKVFATYKFITIKDVPSEKMEDIVIKNIQ